MSNELLPCFCGATRGNALAVWEIAGEGWRAGCVNEECLMAEVVTKPYPTEAEALAAWNRRFVCYDKNGKPVYAGDEFNFLSDCDPPIKLHFAWSVPQLRYMYENERGDTWRPNRSDKIELIESESEEDKIALLESLGWDYAESSDGTGDMFMYWEDAAKDMPEWCPDGATSCECLEDVWRWYIESESGQCHLNNGSRGLNL